MKKSSYQILKGRYADLRKELSTLKVAVYEKDELFLIGVSAEVEVVKQTEKAIMFGVRDGRDGGLVNIITKKAG